LEHDVKVIVNVDLVGEIAVEVKLEPVSRAGLELHTVELIEVNLPPVVNIQAMIREDLAEAGIRNTSLHLLGGADCALRELALGVDDSPRSRIICHASSHSKSST
jgi:hypothetical protein